MHQILRYRFIDLSISQAQPGGQPSPGSSRWSSSPEFPAASWDDRIRQDWTNSTEILTIQWEMSHVRWIHYTLCTDSGAAGASQTLFCHMDRMPTLKRQNATSFDIFQNKSCVHWIRRTKIFKMLLIFWPAAFVAFPSLVRVRLTTTGEVITQSFLKWQMARLDFPPLKPSVRP